MCGIIGYVGNRSGQELLTVLVDGLARVEYRGYDSAGLAVFGPDSQIQVVKRAGKILELKAALAGFQPTAGIGLAHTRWATHGPPADRNAHPHQSCHGEVAVVHNGIITNFRELRQELSGRGHRFTSETDTEVLAHLIEECLNGNSPREAVRDALQVVEGTYGLAVMFRDHADCLVFARRGSPLLIGVGQDEYFVASDAASFRQFTNQQVVVEEGQLGLVTRAGYQLFAAGETLVSPKIQQIEWDLEQIERGGFPHFMLREICHQPKSLADSLGGRLSPDGEVKLGGLESVKAELAAVRDVVFVAAGTSLHAGMIGEILMEEIAGVASEWKTASELANQQRPCFPEGTAFWAISQSGETADLLLAVKQVKDRDWPVYGLCNVVGSSVARETAAGVYTHAGPEIGVASTKAFTSQVLALQLVSVYLRRLRGLADEPWMGKYLEEIRRLPELVERALAQDQAIQKLAERCARHPNFLFLGRGINFPVALEGALKLKEISYLHAEGYPAGEMKHGPLALIDENFPTIVIVPRNDVFYPKIISNIEELRARGGLVFAIASEGDQEIEHHVDAVIRVPRITYYLTPLLFVVPLQLLAYHVAVLLGRDVDQPRNLAKSVTVE